MAYSTIDKSTANFNTYLYTGNGSTNTISGLGHQPDWVWTKRRDNTGDHAIYDSVTDSSETLIFYKGILYAGNNKHRVINLTAFIFIHFPFGTVFQRKFLCAWSL